MNTGQRRISRALSYITLIGLIFFGQLVDVEKIHAEFYNETVWCTYDIRNSLYVLGGTTLGKAPENHAIVFGRENYNSRNHYVGDLGFKYKQTNSSAFLNTPPNASSYMLGKYTDDLSKLVASTYVQAFSYKDAQYGHDFVGAVDHSGNTILVEYLADGLPSTAITGSGAYVGIGPVAIYSYNANLTGMNGKTLSTPPGCNMGRYLNTSLDSFNFNSQNDLIFISYSDGGCGWGAGGYIRIFNKDLTKNTNTRIVGRSRSNSGGMPRILGITSKDEIALYVPKSNGYDKIAIQLYSMTGVFLRESTGLVSRVMHNIRGSNYVDSEIILKNDTFVVNKNIPTSGLRTSSNALQPNKINQTDEYLVTYDTQFNRLNATYIRGNIYSFPFNSFAKYSYSVADENFILIKSFINSPIDYLVNTGTKQYVTKILLSLTGFERIDRKYVENTFSESYDNNIFYTKDDDNSNYHNHFLKATKPCNVIPTPINGTCGSSQGKSFQTAPNTNLCSIGSNGAVTQLGNNWIWSCNGQHNGSTSICTAIQPINGSCGSANGISFILQPLDIQRCTSGTPTPYVSSGSTLNWTCQGLNNGSNVSCSATKTTIPAPVCGSANNSNQPKVPMNNLCGTGTATAVTQSGNVWKWTCINGETSTPCSANVLIVPGTCGSANGGAFQSTPTTNLCGTGTASTVTQESNIWKWSCSNNDVAASCSANVTIVAGVCGSANGGTFQSIPTTDLCSTGSATAVTESEIGYLWTCSSVNSTAVGCSATKNIPMTPAPLPIPNDFSGSYEPIRRYEAGIILAQFAQNVLKRTPDTNKKCNFNDISSLSQTDQNWLLLSCQFNIMGLIADGEPDIAFRPMLYMTREMFIVTLSRLLYGDQFNTKPGEPHTMRSVHHVQKLKEEGIVTVTDKEALEANELKGYVLIMLERAGRMLGF